MVAQDEIITYRKPTIWGRSFHCSRRTAAWLDFLQDMLPERCDLRIIQGCYNTTVSASAGTHDYDAVLDVYVTGLDWYEMQRVIRMWGGAAWWRTPSQGFTHHIHFVVLGYRTRVGIYVPGQVQDYYNHRSGLAGHGPDPSWHPSPQFVFDYTRYINGDYKGTDVPEHNGGPMPDISDFLNAKIMKDGTTVKDALIDAVRLRSSFSTFREAEMKRDLEERARMKRMQHGIFELRKVSDDPATPAEVRTIMHNQLERMESDLSKSRRGGHRIDRRRCQGSEQGAMDYLHRSTQHSALQGHRRFPDRLRRRTGDGDHPGERG